MSSKVMSWDAADIAKMVQATIAALEAQQQPDTSELDALASRVGVAGSAPAAPAAPAEYEDVPIYNGPLEIVWQPGKDGAPDGWYIMGTIGDADPWLRAAACEKLGRLHYESVFKQRVVALPSGNVWCEALWISQGANTAGARETVSRIWDSIVKASNKTRTTKVLPALGVVRIYASKKAAKK
jgi:hypothetical protein